jgi:hypothetical protein
MNKYYIIRTTNNKMPHNNYHPGNLAFCKCGRLLSENDGLECDTCFQIRWQEKREKAKLKKEAEKENNTGEKK